MKNIFILGSERSGSTWVGNIFDAHPGVEFFMEPFADYTRIFPLVPVRNFAVWGGGDERVIGEVREGFVRLTGYKYPLVYRFGGGLVWKRLDWGLIRLYAFLKKKLRSPLPLGYWRWHLMNLNGFDIPIGRQTSKDSVPGFTVTKELRLNFKVPLISQVFSGADYVVCMRHPGAQVSSVMKLFRKGSLGELRRSLETFVRDVLSNREFESYHGIVMQRKWEADSAGLLALWWCINYNVLLADLKRCRCRFRVVYHEVLSSDPLKTVNDIFSFSRLDVGEAVKRYVETSSRAKAGNVSGERSNTGTDRDSADYCKRMIDAVDPGVNREVGEVLAMFQGIMEPEVRHYWETYYISNEKMSN